MGSITERRLLLEKTVQEAGYEFFNDSPYGCGQPWWEAVHPDSSQSGTHYDKHLGKQGVLDMGAFMHLPKSDRVVTSFFILLYDGPWQAGFRCESYGFWNPRTHFPESENHFYSQASLNPKGLRVLEHRPLKKEEIQDVYEIFHDELKNFGGSNPLVRLVTSLSPIWDRKFILASLDRLKDQAVQMNDYDWERYKHQEELLSQYGA